MAIIGIIAEFNPLHSGHKMLIDKAKEGGNTVVCAISGNFVQRGDISVVSKQKRAEMALKCGADIVAEIPVLWSMSTAQNFALAGVWQLYNLNCEEIIFGSECGDIEALTRAADILLSDKFSAIVSEKIKSGVTFAAAREDAAKELGIDGDSRQNDASEPLRGNDGRKCLCELTFHALDVLLHGLVALLGLCQLILNFTCHNYPYPFFSVTLNGLLPLVL